MCVCVCVCVCVRIHTCMSISHSVVSDSLRHHVLYPARFLCAWDIPGKNTGAGSLSLLQGSFLTQGLNLDLLHCRQIFYLLSHRGKWNWKSLVVSDSLPCHRLYSLWNSPGQNIGVGSLSNLQKWNPGLPPCRWILYQLSHKDTLCSAYNVANANIITSPNSILGKGTSHYTTFA